MNTKGSGSEMALRPLARKTRGSPGPEEARHATETSSSQGARKKAEGKS